MTKSAPVLVLDTSIQGVSMALVDAAAPQGKQELWSGAHPENMGAIAQIAAVAAAGLAAAKLSVADLAGLAVGVGPGSFTGIKIGLAFAFGLRTASGKALPMLALSALDAAAAGLAADGFDSPLALFLPATRTHGYLAVAGGAGPAFAGHAAPARLVEAGAALRRDVQTWPEGLRIAASGRWPLVTELVKDTGRSITEWAPSEVCRLAICGMAEQAVRAWPDEYRVAKPEPRYLRPSTAEEKRLSQAELSGEKT